MDFSSKTRLSAAFVIATLASTAVITSGIPVADQTKVAAIASTQKIKCDQQDADELLQCTIDKLLAQIVEDGQSLQVPSGFALAK